MKAPILILTAVILLSTACKKEDTTPVPNPPTEVTPTDVVVRTGTFVSSAHPTTGTAKIIKSGTQLRLDFENLKSDNGPDLRVYLASNLQATTFKDLGKLKALTGNQSYTIDSSIDLNTYTYVIIWCEDFSVNFGYAKLSM